MILPEKEFRFYDLLTTAFVITTSFVITIYTWFDGLGHLRNKRKFYKKWILNNAIFLLAIPLMLMFRVISLVGIYNTGIISFSNEFPITNIQRLLWLGPVYIFFAQWQTAQVYIKTVDIG